MKKRLIILPIVILVFFVACGPKPCCDDLKYTIKNNSKYNIELSIYKAKFMHSLIKDTTITISSNTEFNYEIINNHQPFGMSPDSACVHFNNEKKIIYKRDDGQERNILDIDNWTGGKVLECLYEYEYTITNEDYANAVPIE